MALWRRVVNAYRGARIGFRAGGAGFDLAAGGGTSAYEGATSGRRLGLWGLGGWGPTSAVDSSLAALRSRSREFTRNNPWARQAVDSWVANLVGTGITPRWDLGDQNLKRTLQGLFLTWTDQADPDGRCDWYGQQALAARTWFEAGECLARFRVRPLSDGLAVPLQVQLLEPDHLDTSRDGILPDGRVIRAGIELDRRGRRIAYHLFSTHPGEAVAMSGNGRSRDTVRVPADEILHIYQVERPGQMRGVPRFAAAALRLFEFDAYEDAELVRKKAAASIGGFITEEPSISSTTVSLPFGTNEGEDAEGQTQVAFEPGMYGLLRPGQKVSFSPPADVGASYAEWAKQQLRAIAAAYGLTYEQLTGDYSQVNFSSVRAALVEFRRRVLQQVWHIMVYQFCQPVAVRWMELAVASGAVRIPDFATSRARYTRIAWRPQRFDFVDPLKDVLAEKEAVRSGFKSRTGVVAELGDDVEAIDAETEADNRRADAAGLVYDSDPRKTAGSGAIQAETLVTGEGGPGA